MATQKKATKKMVKTPAKAPAKTPVKTVAKTVAKAPVKAVAKVSAPKTVETCVQTKKDERWREIFTRVVLVFETAVLYFIILFIVFVANNFTVMFFPKG